MYRITQKHCSLVVRCAVSRRLSGRIAGLDAVVYNDSHVFLDDRNNGNVVRSEAKLRAVLPGRFAEEGGRPEVYSESHVQALGSSKTEWGLFKDGFDASTGKRVRDYQQLCFQILIIFLANFDPVGVACNF